MDSKYDLVTCAVCGKQMSVINNRHLATHEMTAVDYRARYPEHNLVSDTVAKKLSDRSIKSNAHRIGVPRSEEVKAAMRAASQKLPSTKGIPKGPMKETTKLKLSEAAKSRFSAGVQHPRKGAKLDETTRARISKTLTGRTLSPDDAAAITSKIKATKKANGTVSGWKTGPLSKEHKAKIAAAVSLRYENTRSEIRAPMLEKIAKSGLVLLNNICEPVFELRCLVCSHEFTRTPQVFQPSKWSPEVCDQCFPVSKTSVGETEIGAFVGGVLGDRIVRSCMDSIPPLELDVFVPEKRLAIEYCGLWWHSEIAGKHKMYHRFKFDKCKSTGIKLITIFEDEWANNRELCESMISGALGHHRVRLNGRDCIVREITQAEASPFLLKNHIMGQGRSKYKYGLFHGDALVSVMTFSIGELSRKNAGCEINRLCSKKGVVIRGGASKIFKRFINDHPEITSVTSYADLRWGDGAVYQYMGFINEGMTVPNYWYFRPNELRRYHRYVYRKLPDEPAGITEWTLRQAEGLNRIWDCGHAKWTWARDK